MDTRLEISRGPSGLRLHLPSGRTLDISASAAGARMIEEILRNADEYVKYDRQRAGHIGAFPTQAILDTWNDRAEIERQAQVIKAEKALAKRQAIKAEWEEHGIDITAMEFKI